MALIIAEKPSLARAIAEALDPQHRRQGNSLLLANGDVVAWCVGHILEMAPPEAYSEALKQWELGPLPIVPHEWRLVPKNEDLVKGLTALIRKAHRIVHAGDPDREGQLLVDELLTFVGYQGPVDRVLVRDQNPQAVRAAFGALQPNSDFKSQSEAALGRQRADWLFGLNLTRLYSLLGQQGGYDGVLSVGRVQTPVLGLIVQRDLEIADFKPRPFFTIQGTMTAEGGAFNAQWRPREEDAPFLDEEGRLTSTEKARQVQARTEGQLGKVTRASRKKVLETAPLPYSLADLQIDANRQLGLSTKEVLEIAQSLYETHRLTTYPRSDCSYLPESHHAQGPQVARAVARVLPGLSIHVAGADFTLRSRAWNDKKVTAHFGIIPTPAESPPSGLTEQELRVYDLVARRYLQQFYPPYEYLQAELQIDVAGEHFRVTGRQPLLPGWRKLQPASNSQADDADDGEASAPAVTTLPQLNEGDRVKAAPVTILERKTQPPKPYTEGTLTEAIINIGKHCRNPKLKELFQKVQAGVAPDARGIGTPATRANILETLFKRSFVEKKGKAVISTLTGRALIKALPDVVTTPDMTALWEDALQRVQAGDGKLTLEDFLAGVTKHLRSLVEEGRRQGPLAIAAAYPCPKPPCAGSLRSFKGSKGRFWSCRICRATVEDANGKPASPGAGRPGAKRPRKSGLGKRTATSGARKPSLT
ncbi:DNA topoisomerase III [Myxococcus llanfairpwllgwyngyllgogerychwyrndrobwllllantysiliogogogochensis]|uniref:DNA topoisomerase n=1 Tax=Myxococcus llanfairpwllgwyngyllgogerychwyrndrobwllllantysiliogogogochensis TaxID=2590453 RepID=A0A540WWQ1_9BACT|nr:DNA topoisomerase III [Myxococcus llanfairpwllgwyngyllgogerychwyrndrobwllllantysiliogogogochensis]TQF13426.1 DNA topoisomerase III [Myxococcus llanfairpwllgwyngyllgogerychwyrndrobwllllantysiliogogogochensis]